MGWVGGGGFLRNGDVGLGVVEWKADADAAVFVPERMRYGKDASRSYVGVSRLCRAGVVSSSRVPPTHHHLPPYGWLPALPQRPTRIASPTGSGGGRMHVHMCTYISDGVPGRSGSHVAVSPAPPENARILGTLDRRKRSRCRMRYAAPRVGVSGLFQKAAHAKPAPGRHCRASRCRQLPSWARHPFLAGEHSQAGAAVAGSIVSTVHPT